MIALVSRALTAWVVYRALCDRHAIRARRTREEGWRMSMTDFLTAADVTPKVRLLDPLRGGVERVTIRWTFSPPGGCQQPVEGALP